MCPPDFYGIEYEINAWMDRERQADHDLAVRQWQDLRQHLMATGAEICELTPQPGLPDLVFTANAALIHRDRSIVSNFRHPQRQGEQPVNEAWFAAHGFRVEPLPPTLHFEGAGDALFCGETLFAGYQIRSHAVGHQEVARRSRLSRHPAGAGGHILLPPGHLLLSPLTATGHLLSGCFRRIRIASDSRARAGTHSRRRIGRLDNSPAMPWLSERV